jgi:CheY-like chemotaxis protein
MHRVLWVSDNPSNVHWERLLLKRGGHRVVSAIDAADASSLIRAGNIDAIVLGTAVEVHDRASVALLGVMSNIPVICMCGVRSEPGCPVIHVPPSCTAQLFTALAESGLA